MDACKIYKRVLCKIMLLYNDSSAKFIGKLIFSENNNTRLSCITHPVFIETARNPTQVLCSNNSIGFITQKYFININVTFLEIRLIVI